MKINTPKKSKKLIVISTLIVIAIAGLAIAYSIKVWPFRPPSSASTINTQPPSKEQRQAGESTKKDTVDSQDQEKSSGSDQPLPPTPQPSGKPTVALSFTAANQNSDVLQVRSLIEAVSSNGTCTLTFTRTGYPAVTKKAAVQALSSTSTCQGFDVPVSELAAGVWNMSLTFENDTVKGATSKTVTIQ